MVNIPPIPPLLCSTPPPIDFGDDEDLDSMPPSLDDVEDDFGGFLIDNGIKTEEALPSPRPPSVCDLPTFSIYDGLIPLEEKELTRHIESSSLQSPDAKKMRGKQHNRGIQL
ncbi:hypothetical protein EVAR_71495_1 [Eumeta japonica]|uniref:Uncharacterized protein n=1 Tax=Eumeta variegata TaxID=151549 RepID=A0A4C2ABM0_EUMVA|nr:hypothetical protein EVAR_71495_1 [Eumeta japonica]